MSGYTEDELIGAPHSILRHPDMPKAAFKDLWIRFSAGRSGRVMSKTCVKTAVSTG
jgi:hypothetical protein